MVKAEVRGTLYELRMIGQRAFQVLRLVSRPRKFALGGATALMVLTSAANTCVALLLGWLVDRIHTVWMNIYHVRLFMEARFASSG